MKWARKLALLEKVKFQIQSFLAFQNVTLLSYIYRV